ncbi:MAG: glycosyltransferase [Eubacteriales bacterium]|nr:glycosyltransferase [Eubacteriales bacterium]
MSPIATIRNKITSAGIRSAEQIRAAAVRATAKNGRVSYAYVEPHEDVLRMQETISERLREGESPESVLGASIYLQKEARPPFFSVFIAVREPDLRLFRSTLTSVLEQTYGEFEIFILDRGISDQVRDVIAWYRESRLHYLDFSDGTGFAGVFNRAAAQAGGDYIIRLECGDLLTKDALFEAALAVMQTDAEILFTDEDRCDSRGRHFSDPFFKPDFSLDYLYTTDYMSRALIVRRSLFLALRFREEYEDAPEYDFLLRAPKSGIHHIPRVLCHVRQKGSLPSGVMDARKRALIDYFSVRRVRASVHPTPSTGMMEIEYIPDIFTARRMVGVVGGKVLDEKHRIIGGMQDERGNVLFEGWDEAEEGPHLIAQTMQNAWAVDVRCMRIRKELYSLYEEVFGCSYEGHVMYRGENLGILSRQFCTRVREMGYTIIWNPALRRVIRS